jgi:hypothetical protein
LFKSSITSSCHHCLGLPTCLVPIRFQSNSYQVDLAWSILCIWPSHSILCALMNLTTSASSINLPISTLFHILYILSIMTGPNVFLSICLSKMHRCCQQHKFTNKSFLCKAQYFPMPDTDM